MRASWPWQMGQWTCGCPSVVEVQIAPHLHSHLLRQVIEPSLADLPKKVHRYDGLNTSMARYLGSKTPLASAGVWTDTANAGQEDWIVGLIFSDQAGNLFVEQSVDNSNWDYTSAAYAVVAGTGKTFKEEIFAPYIRLRYVNGATLQGVFRISAHFSSAGYR